MLVLLRSLFPLVPQVAMQNLASWGVSQSHDHRFQSALKSLLERVRRRDEGTFVLSCIRIALWLSAA